MAPDVASAAPELSSLRLAETVTAQRGHARFLVGARLSEPAAEIVVQVSSASTDRLVRTARVATQPAGRAYLAVEGVSDSGFQLPAGPYRVSVRARDGAGGLSNELAQTFRLRLTAPRGRLDAYTIPVWPPFARQLGAQRDGQLVAAVAPGGAAVAAGLRRGDVIIAIGGRRVTTAGSMLGIRRALLAQRPIAVRFVRNGTARTATVTLAPDWTPAAEYAASLRIATTREPQAFAWAYARLADLIESGELESGRELIDAWPASWSNSGPGQLLLGELLFAEGKRGPALGAFTRARTRDPQMAPAAFGRGLVYDAQNRVPPAQTAFATAGMLDARDPIAPAFEAYVLIGAERFPEALAAADRAVKLDPRFADAHIPRGIALLKSGQTPPGLIALRRGLLDLADVERVQRLIDEHLEPADP